MGGSALCGRPRPSAGAWGALTARRGGARRGWQRRRAGPGPRGLTWEPRLAARMEGDGSLTGSGGGLLCPGAIPEESSAIPGHVWSGAGSAALPARGGAGALPGPAARARPPRAPRPTARRDPPTPTPTPASRRPHPQAEERRGGQGGVCGCWKFATSPGGLGVVERAGERVPEDSNWSRWLAGKAAHTAGEEDYRGAIPCN